jgi:hypothetical protein
MLRLYQGDGPGLIHTHNAQQWYSITYSYKLQYMCNRIDTVSAVSCRTKRTNARTAVTERSSARAQHRARGNIRDRVVKRSHVYN